MLGFLIVIFLCESVLLSSKYNKLWLWILFINKIIFLHIVVYLCQHPSGKPKFVHNLYKITQSHYFPCSAYGESCYWYMGRWPSLPNVQLASLRITSIFCTTACWFSKFLRIVGRLINQPSYRHGFWPLRREMCELWGFGTSYIVEYWTMSEIAGTIRELWRPLLKFECNCQALQTGARAKPLLTPLI